ncbi:hypothetical protein CR513_33995, partial [Mucuna pruriens]
MRFFVTLYLWKPPTSYWEELDSLTNKLHMMVLLTNFPLSTMKCEKIRKIKKIKLIKSWLVGNSLNKKEPLLLWPTNICLVLNSPLESLPTIFERMLEDFKDLFQEMPKGLPSIRVIKHQSDFFTGQIWRNHKRYNDRHRIPCLDV